MASEDCGCWKRCSCDSRRDGRAVEGARLEGASATSTGGSNPSLSATAIPAYRDPAHEGNSWKYRTGHPCIDGCGREAGTYWSHLWCFECNVARMDRIGATLERLVAESKR